MQKMRGGANTQGLLELIDYLPDETMTMVEVGSYSGESAELFAESRKFSRIVCVDSWDNDVEHLFDAVADRHWVIEKRKGLSVEVAREFPRIRWQCDFIYIDANHEYDHVRQDIEAWRPIVEPGGFMGGHDYNWKFPGVLQAVFEVFGKPEHVFRDGSWLVRIPS